MNVLFHTSEPNLFSLVWYNIFNKIFIAERKIMKKIIDNTYNDVYYVLFCIISVLTFKKIKRIEKKKLFLESLERDIYKI